MSHFSVIVLISGPLDVTVLTDYMTQFSPLHPACDGRLRIASNSSNAIYAANMTYVYIIIALCIYFLC